MATGRQQCWEGEALGLLQIFSLAPLQKISNPLCWYILGRVIFTLRNKHRIIKHQWTDGHIAHRWQHTTLLACRATLGCQTSLKTCCIITLEEQYNLWGCLRLWNGTQHVFDPFEPHTSAVGGKRVTPIFHDIYTWRTSIHWETWCTRNCKCRQSEWMQSRFIEDTQLYGQFPSNVESLDGTVLQRIMTNLNAPRTRQGKNSII